MRIEYVRFATAEEWADIKIQLPEIWKRFTAAGYTPAYENWERIEFCGQLGACLFRDVCRNKTNKTIPTVDSFQGMGPRIADLLLELKRKEPDGSFFCIGHFSRMPSFMRKQVQSHLAGLSEAEKLLQTARMTEVKQCLYICVGRAPLPPSKTIRPAEQLRHPVSRAVPEENRMKAQREDRLARIRSKAHLVVGFSRWDPFIEPASGKGNAKGLYYSLLQQLARTENWQVSYERLVPDEAKGRLQRGDIDLAAGFVETPRRREDWGLRFAPFLHSVHFLVAVRNDLNHSVESLRDLEGQKVVVRANSAGHDLARDMFGIEEDSIVAHGGDEAKSSLHYLFNSDTVKAAITDAVTFKRYVSENLVARRKLRILNPTVAAFRLGFIMQPDQPEFAEWLTRSVRKVIDTEQFGRIEEKALAPYGDFVHRCWVPRPYDFVESGLRLSAAQS